MTHLECIQNIQKINDDLMGMYNTNSQTKFKTLVWKTSLYDYIDAYIVVKGTLTVVGVGATAALTTKYRENKQVILENCALFTDCISKINETQLDNAKDLSIVMWIDNLIGYTKSYLKKHLAFTSFSLKWPKKSCKRFWII